MESTENRRTSIKKTDNSSRPQQYFDVGHVGRKTGISGPVNPRKDAFGRAVPEEYLPDTPIGKEIDSGKRKSIVSTPLEARENTSPRFVYTPTNASPGTRANRLQERARRLVKFGDSDEVDPITPAQPSPVKSPEAVKGSVSSPAIVSKPAPNGADSSVDFWIRKTRVQRTSLKPVTQEDEVISAPPSEMLSPRVRETPQASPRRSRNPSPQKLDFPTPQRASQSPAREVVSSPELQIRSLPASARKSLNQSKQASPAQASPAQSFGGDIFEGFDDFPQSRVSSHSPEKRQSLPMEAPEPESDPEPAPQMQSESEEEPVIVAPKKRSTQQKKRKLSALQTRFRQEPVLDDNISSDGTRKSKRTKLAPLSWWAGERVEKKRTETGIQTSVIKVDTTEQPKPRKPRKTGPKIARGIQVDTADDRREAVDMPVLEYAGPGMPTTEVMKKIFAPLPSMELRPVANEKYQFGKAFGEGDFCACGQMLIPPGEEKPTKNTRANAMMFCVLQGKVMATVNSATFEARPGDSFMVPRGNQYRLTNPSSEDARLFFAHAREVVEQQA